MSLSVLKFLILVVKLGDYCLNFFSQVGVMGLVEEEWIETLATLDPEDVTYLDFVSKAIELCKDLKQKVLAHCLFNVWFKPL